MNEQTIGFIGTGYVGGSLANNFKSRGFNVVQYSKEEEYVGNKEKLKDCDIVFIAVPTPTTNSEFDDSIVINVVGYTKPGDTVVIKSTILPSTADKLVKKYSDRYILVCPEFLVASNAQNDTDNPERNIVGVADLDDKEYLDRARKITEILPKAKIGIICSNTEACLIKYAGNCFFYFKVIYFNMLHDLVVEKGGDWETVRHAVSNDSRISESHTVISHDSGRGAGGPCLIKDYVAFMNMYLKDIGTSDLYGCQIIAYMEKKNKQLLTESQKDLDLLKDVYGEY